MLDLQDAKFSSCITVILTVNIRKGQPQRRSDLRKCCTLVDGCDAAVMDVEIEVYGSTKPRKKLASNPCHVWSVGRPRNLMSAVFMQDGQVNYINFNLILNLLFWQSSAEVDLLN